MGQLERFMSMSVAFRSDRLQLIITVHDNSDYAWSSPSRTKDEVAAALQAWLRTVEN